MPLAHGISQAITKSNNTCMDAKLPASNEVNWEDAPEVRQLLGIQTTSAGDGLILSIIGQNTALFLRISVSNR
jgi:hypothetical protein